MFRNWRDCSGLLAVVLCHILVVQAVVGQQSLNIVVLQGEGAHNVVQQIAARPITVRIEDSGGRPVVGARVTFSSPQLGPSGDFSNDLRTLELISDGQGQAVADHYHPNAIAGAYVIEVVAEYQGQMARRQIKQENGAQSKSHGKMFAVLAVVGAAGAAIAVSSLKKKSSTAPPVTGPTITLGGTAVGAPSQ